MKTLYLSLLWIVLFALFFFLLSVFGLLWESTYRSIITDGNWFGMYCVAVGWWLPTVIVVEEASRIS